MKGFSIVRADRANRMEGGVCFKTIKIFSNPTCELLIIQLDAPNVVLINMYRPPNCSPELFDEMLYTTEQCLLSPLFNPLATGYLYFKVLCQTGTFCRLGMTIEV